MVFEGEFLPMIAKETMPNIETAMEALFLAAREGNGAESLNWGEGVKKMFGSFVGENEKWAREQVMQLDFQPVGM